jgi:hypothetical protein
MASFWSGERSFASRIIACSPSSTDRFDFHSRMAAKVCHGQNSASLRFRHWSAHPGWSEISQL